MNYINYTHHFFKNFEDLGVFSRGLDFNFKQKFNFFKKFAKSNCKNLESHTIGPVYEIYNNNDYELTRTLPNSNTVELYDKYYFNYNDVTSELHGSLCVKRGSNQVECFDGKYEEKVNSSIFFLRTLYRKRFECLL